MDLDVAAIVVAVMSFGVAFAALLVSLRRFEVQRDQHALQLKEFELENQIQLYIKDEQFLTSHIMGPNEPKHYVEHPEEIEFEYRASYINRGNANLIIDSLILHISAFDIENLHFGAGDKILMSTPLIQNEEIQIRHRINKRNLDGFISFLERKYGKRGVLEFEIECSVSGPNEQQKKHKRMLYRLVEAGGDQSSRGYRPGKGKEKHSFLY